MAGSVNTVFLVGNVGKDPEIRATQSGERIANLSLATSEHWTDKSSGERKEKTEWHRISIFNPRIVDVVEKYVRKGSSICVQGPLQTRKWTDNAGVEKYSTEVVVGRFRGEITLLGSKGDAAPERAAGPAAAGVGGGGAGLDDDIPF